MTKENIIEKLNNAGIRPSVQRVAIAHFISESKTHPTVDDIFLALQKEFPTLSRTTVYNTVWLLADAGVINAVNIERINTRFDLEEKAHAHFRCKGCGAVIDIAMPTLGKCLPSQYRIDVVNVYYEGICDKCLNK